MPLFTSRLYTLPPGPFPKQREGLQLFAQLGHLRETYLCGNTSDSTARRFAPYTSHFENVPTARWLRRFSDQLARSLRPARPSKGAVPNLSQTAGARPDKVCRSNCATRVRDSADSAPRVTPNSADFWRASSPTNPGRVIGEMYASNRRFLLRAKKKKRSLQTAVSSRKRRPRATSRFCANPRRALVLPILRPLFPRVVGIWRDTPRTAY